MSKRSFLSTILGFGLLPCLLTGPDAGAQEFEHRRMEVYPEKIIARLEARNRAQLAAIPREVDGQPSSLVIQTLQKWVPGQTVTVAFRGGDADLYREIAEEASEWTQHANLTFDFGFNPATDSFREWSPDDEEYAADIRVGFDDPGGGYWSLVGTDSIDPQVVGAGEASMNLDGFAEDRPPDWAGTVKHEFGHAISAQHEHQHPSEGCDYEFRWENEPGYMPTTNSFGGYIPDANGKRPGIYQVLGGPPNNWPSYKVDHNLKQLRNSFAFEWGPFDQDSIMKYYFPAWMFVRGQESPCWTGTDNNILSARDRENVRQFYPHEIGEIRQLIAQRRTFQTVLSALENITDEQKRSFDLRLAPE